MNESNRDGDHGQVWLPSIPHFWHWLSGDLCGDSAFVRSLRQYYRALATDGDTSSVSSACAFTLLISALTSRPALLGVSAQMHSVSIACKRVVSISLIRRLCLSCRRRTAFIHLLGVKCLVSFSDCLAGYSFPTTPSKS